MKNLVKVLAASRSADDAMCSPRNVPARPPCNHGTGVLGTTLPMWCTTRRTSLRYQMTNPPPQEEWDPGRRKDATRTRTDRRRLGWNEFRRSYPGVIATMSVAIGLFLAIDVLMVMRYQRYRSETQELRAGMTDVERKRTDEVLAQNENRLKVMVAMFKKQAKVDPTLHLSVSLDSSVMYLEREGALLREMPITVGPERRVGTAPDTVHIAAHEANERWSDCSTRLKRGAFPRGSTPTAVSPPVSHSSRARSDPRPSCSTAAR